MPFPTSQIGEGVAKRLFERFALPSEKAAASKLAEMHELFGEAAPPATGLATKVMERAKRYNKEKFLADSVVQEPVYHSTRSSFDVFHTSPLGAHVGTREAAQDRLDQFWEGDAARATLSNLLSKKETKRFHKLSKTLTNQSLRQGKVDEKLLQEVTDLGERGANIMPLHMRLRNPARALDAGDWNVPDSVLAALQGEEEMALMSGGLPENFRKVFSSSEEAALQKRIQGLSDLANVPTRRSTPPASQKEIDAFWKKEMAGREEGLRLIKEALHRKGYDGIVYANAMEDMGVDSYIVFRPSQLKSVFNRGTWNPRVGNILKGVGAGVAAGTLLGVDEAEASPRISGEMWKKLLEETLPIAKELVASKGPVEFDAARKMWSKRLNPFTFKPVEDTEKFLKWVQPYLKIAEQRDPRAYRDVVKWIEMADIDKSPKLLEFALINLHRVIAHEAPSAKALDEMMTKYPLADLKKALLSHVKDPEVGKATESLLRRWSIYGAAGAAVGLGGMLGPEEAEAGPIKPPTRLIKDIAKKVGAVSSASARLEGMDLMGKIIKSVRKGQGNWRYIVFEDGTYSVMDKKYIASLTSAEGEKGYTGMFEMLGKKSEQTDMIRKSQAIRQAERTTYGGLKEGLQRRASNLEELGESAPTRMDVMLGGKKRTLPAPYSEWLKKHGPPKVEVSPESLLKQAPKYDFGGGEGPYSSRHTVVDILPLKEAKIYAEDTGVPIKKYVQHDLSKPLKLSPGAEIHMGQFVRHIKSSDVSTLVNNIDENLLFGGRVLIRDTSRYKSVKETLQELQSRGYALKEDLGPNDPSERIFTLTKPIPSPTSLRGIRVLEDVEKARPLSDAEGYILKRLKGVDQATAAKGLKINITAIEKMAQKLGAK